MTLEHHLNPGNRPSRLDVARLHTGEIQGEEAEALRLRIAADPRATAWLRELEAAVGACPPCDVEILRKLAFRVGEAERRQEAPAPEPRRRAWLPQLALALAALVALVVVALPPDTGVRDPGETVRAKGDDELGFYVLRDGDVHPGSEDELHHAGDGVQFTYRTTGADTLVLLSVDGRGDVNVYWPSSGDAPLPVVPGERRVLPGSVTLDDAPGFDLFLAFFGARSVVAVVEEVEEVLGHEGVEGLLRLAEEDPFVDAVHLRKAER